MKRALALLTVLGLAALAAPVAAQVIYEPVRYQYGQYGEVFYGGRNPAMFTHGYVYLPPSLQNVYAAQRLNTASGVNGYSPDGTSFTSPYYTSSTLSDRVNVPLVFTDYLPYVEVGQFGYTPTDARNEAYANVPRIQTGYHHEPAESAAPAPVAQPSPPTDPHVKVIPLLNWAKAERTRNPTLYAALMQEARKLDPEAAAKMEQSASASEK